MLNFTLETFYILIAMIGTFFAFINMSIQVIKGLRYRYFIILLIVWFLYFVILVSWFLAILLVELNVLILIVILYVTLGFFMLLSSDTISHEATDPVKIIIYLFFAGIAIYESIQSNVGFVHSFNNGEMTLVMAPSVLIIQTPFFLFYNLTYLFTLGKMVRHAPSKLKYYTHIAFWGYVIMVIPGLVFMIINPYTDYIFSGIQFIFVTIGILMLNFTILKQPKMIFILPFKALRLTILHSISGISLFDYKWEKDKEQLDEILYTSMLQGVNLIIKESLDRGQVEEIKTSRAIILARHSNKNPITCILVSVKASKTLREALKQFAEKFEEQYSKFLPKYSETSNFSSAIELIKQYFPFIPQ